MFNSLSSIVNALIAGAIFGIFCLFVEITWVLWRRSHGKRRDKIEKDLIPLVILHLSLFFLYFTFSVTWAIVGIAKAIRVSEQAVLFGGVLGFLLTGIYIFVRGSQLNRLLFPAMYFRAGTSSPQDNRFWQSLEPIIQLSISMAIFLGSVLSVIGTVEYAIFLIFAGYLVANLMLFYGLLVLYQLAVLLITGNRDTNA